MCALKTTHICTNAQKGCLTKTRLIKCLFREIENENTISAISDFQRVEKKYRKHICQ